MFHDIFHTLPWQSQHVGGYPYTAKRRFISPVTAAFLLVHVSLYQ